MQTDLAGRLAGIAGRANVLTGGSAAEYGRDATFLRGIPSVAVRPRSTEEVAAVARLCSELRVPVVTRGAGSGLVGGPVPLEPAVILSTELLASIEVRPQDLTASAGAGVITADLDAAAAEHGLMYPPDPASVAISSIGGNVACNSGGLRCLKYGVTADYVIGLTVVLIDGTVLRLGGHIRKRASGYRLAALFVGSEGTLGIVTEVIVKLVPRPRHAATAMVTFESIERAAAGVARLLQSGHLPAALELINGPALRIVAPEMPAGIDAGAGAVLLVEQDGSEPDVVLSELGAMVEVLGGLENRIAQSGPERDGLWRARRSFGRLIRAAGQRVFSEDIVVPISLLPEMARRLQAMADRSGIEIPMVAHAGDGNLHPTFVLRADQGELVGRLAAQIFRDAVELGGTISGEHGLGALKRDFAELEHGPEAIGWWRRLKDMFDPQGLLNPHKVFPEHPADEGFLDRQPGWSGEDLPAGEVSA